MIERLPTPTDATVRELRRLRAQLSDDPKNLDLAIRLAKRYIQVSRAESDPRYRGYAQAALQPWWSLTNPPIQVLVLRATLRQSRHDFEGALADLARVLAFDPRNGQAWLTRAVILQVQGQYSEATRSCQRLQPIAGPLVTETCLASTASLNGQARRSYKRLNDALELARNTDHGIRLWSLTVLAEIAIGLGNDAAAERHFRQAFDLGLRDGYLLGAYTDFLLDQGRAQEVRDLLADETRADGLLLRLALAERRLGRAEFADHVAALAARFEASRRRGDSIHLREEARFALHLQDDPARALELAKANWLVQREPWDARLVLEAAAATAPEAATTVLAWLKAKRLENKRIQTLARHLRRPNR